MRLTAVYIRTLRASELVVSVFEDPEPTEEFLITSPQGPWIAEITMHCEKEDDIVFA